MTWWQWALAIGGGGWALIALATASEKAERAAGDAAMLRFELEQLKLWLERTAEIQMAQQRTALERLQWIRERMGWQEDETDPFSDI